MVAPLAEGRECFLLFTHSDYDHIIGYGKFSHFRTIASEAFAHTTDREKALRQVTDWDDSNYVTRDYPLVYPPIDRPIAGQGIEFTLGEDTYAFYQAPGHNADGLITFNRSRGILVVGDYLSNIEFPYIYHSIDDYRTTLDMLEGLIRSGGGEAISHWARRPHDRGRKRCSTASANRGSTSMSWYAASGRARPSTWSGCWAGMRTRRSCGSFTREMWLLPRALHRRSPPCCTTR